LIYNAAGVSRRSKACDNGATREELIEAIRELGHLLGLFLAAVILAAGARRVGAPYPVFLALGGALLAFLPGAPSFTVPPELALALFVAPVLLDAAYDASPRDLRDNWAPVTGLVIFAVGFTTAAVAAVARALIPTLPWAAAITLGAHHLLLRAVPKHPGFALHAVLDKTHANLTLARLQILRMDAIFDEPAG